MHIMPEQLDNPTYDINMYPLETIIFLVEVWKTCNLFNLQSVFSKELQSITNNQN